MERKIKLILGIILILASVALVVFNYPSKISATVYDSETGTPLSDVLVQVKSSSGDSIDIQQIYTDSRGKFSTKITYSNLDSMNLFKEGYLEYYVGNPDGKLKNVNNLYMVSKGSIVSLDSDILISDHFSENSGNIYLENDDAIFVSYEDDGTFSKNRKISYPTGGLLYLGADANYSEIGKIPNEGYSTGEMDFNGGVYAFKTSDDNYGKLDIFYVDSEEEGEFDFWVQGKYVIYTLN